MTSTDWEVTTSATFATFRPISSAARQWAIDVMPGDAKSSEAGYLIRRPSAERLLLDIRAEGFTVSETEANAHG